jgi:hypothetical protein
MKQTILLLLFFYIGLIVNAEVSKTVNSIPGGLSTSLTSDEKTTVTNLTITGSIDTRDFKTMRDSMPVLAVLDLSNVVVVAYVGPEGTRGTIYNFFTYPANTIPFTAFSSNLSGVLKGKTSLTTIFLPSSVTAIDKSAFSYSGLTSFPISSSVTTIGSGAFSYCTGLTSIILPSSVTAIGSSAFSHCNELTSVTIPSSVNSISSNAFNDCSSLHSIYANPIFPVDLSNSSDVFLNVDKTACTLYVTYQTAAHYAAAVQWKDFTTIVEETSGFYLESASETIAVTEGSTANVGIIANVPWTASTDQSWLTASPLAGNGNTSIILTAKTNPLPIARVANLTVSVVGKPSKTTKVTQYGTTKTIETTAGGLLSALTSEELNGVTNLTLKGTIDARDFKTMRDKMPLLSVLDLSGVSVVAYTGTDGTCPSYYGSYTYPANEISQYAFYETVVTYDKKNTKLTSFIFPATATSIGYSAFKYCGGLTTIEIPSTITSISDGSFSSFNGLITVDANNPNYSSIDGVLFNKAQTQLLQCPVSKTGSYTIPSQVTTIGSGAFDGCTELTSISIPTSVTTIGQRAFGGCSGLTSVIIPTSVIYIYPGAFSGCSGLKSMVIPSSVTYVGYDLFRDCTSLTSVTFSPNEITIDENTFYNCKSLTTISIPSSVNYIGGSAFSGCTGLTSIYAYPLIPISLNPEDYVFQNVDKTTCTLYVPVGSKSSYQTAVEWKDFTNIVEIPGFRLSKTIASVSAKRGGTDFVNVYSYTSWNASSDQSWLSVSPETGTGDNTLVFTASANTALTERTAIVTVSATGFPSQTITVTQAVGEAGVPLNKTVSSITLSSGKVDCFNATDSITVAGNGTTVLFESGSSATLIAGKSIRFLPGFWAKEGSTMDATITTTNLFCDGQSGSIVEQPQEKSIAEETIQKDQMKEVEGENSIKVYPNPNTGSFTAQTSVEGESRLTITSLSGQKVYGPIGFTENIKVQLNGLARGIYLCRIQNKQGVQVRKIEVN